MPLNDYVYVPDGVNLSAMGIVENVTTRDVFVKV